MKDISNAIGTATHFVIAGKKSCVIFLEPFSKKPRKVSVTSRGKATPNDFSLVTTYGRLNHREREYLKLCKKAGVKRIPPWFGSRKEVTK